jgi:hypothetical protein
MTFYGRQWGYQVILWVLQILKNQIQVPDDPDQVLAARLPTAKDRIPS